jgi:hypothetical protein
MADALRVICVGLGLPLTFTCVYGVMRTYAWDQKARFLGLSVIGFVVAAGQLNEWGEPVTWYMPLLAVGLAVSLAGTVTYLVKVHRELED